MGLTNEKSLKEIIQVYNLCFDINSLCDRIAYILSINYNMVDFGNWFHHEIAHLFTGDKFADGIESFGELRGDLFYRGNVPEHSETYSSVSDCMEYFVFKIVELQNQTIKAIKECAINNDIAYEDYLREFNKNEIAKILKQSTVLYEAIKSYEDNNSLYKWNKDYKSWVLKDFGGSL